MVPHPRELTEEDISRSALRDVYDPELPVNIVDLGLVYGVALLPDPDAPGMLPRQKVIVNSPSPAQAAPAHTDQRADP